ncbi:hypothetical protein SAMD00023353_1701270 [Rosellinia necatrix]|uniref:Uncharacterized protein n=1 Tax=Rosellinia necatrix TaxID=77044 RepID=A0A1W2TJW1_ROSNE|nr:hypothetical protein SAMD00023353_1701270 [Rosellinia necatrix]
MDPLTQYSQAFGNVDPRLRPSESWSDMPSPQAFYPSPESSLIFEFGIHSDPSFTYRSGSPVSVNSMPYVAAEESTSPTDVSLYSRPRGGSLKRKCNYDDAANKKARLSLPSCQDVVSYCSPFWHEASISQPQNTSLTGPSPSFVADPICEQLNRSRREQNKTPLPEFKASPDRGTSQCPNPTELHYRGYSQRPPTPPLPLSPPPSRSPSEEATGKHNSEQKNTHCNVKYKLEELDYIRYLYYNGTRWGQIETQFQNKFPESNGKSLPRGTQGLQGVHYRQNNLLPCIVDDRLVFMNNGHVRAVSVKTREQGDDKSLYTLVNLYPDRAMNYEWVKKEDRQRAYDLNQDRQRQFEEARLNARARGTYVEKLPSDVLCGCCCPQEDRQMDISRKSLRNGDNGRKPGGRKPTSRRQIQR